jgi:polysaccharide biosynthesis protein PslE
LQASLDFVAPEVTLSKETQRSDAVENARRVLLDLQLKEQDLSAKFSAETPAVQDARGAVARAQGLLAELQAKPSQTVRTGRSAVRDTLESDWLRTKADNGQAGAGEGLLRQQRQAIQEKLKSFAGTQRHLVAMERERKLVESSYEAAVRRLEDALVQDELDRTRKSNVSIVQAARAPLQGRSMQGLILGVGTLLSVCCALLMAFLSALWRDTFLTPEQVQRSLGLPLLTSVPKVG